MKREVVDPGLDVLVLLPPDFYEHANRALWGLPDEWDSVYARGEASYETLENGKQWATDYEGVSWRFLKDGRTVAFMTELPEHMLDDGIRERYLEMVRDAFGKAPLDEA